jgi:hypothetical protein
VVVGDDKIISLLILLSLITFPFTWYEWESNNFSWCITLMSYIFSGMLLTYYMVLKAENKYIPWLFILIYFLEMPTALSDTKQIDFDKYDTILIYTRLPFVLLLGGACIKTLFTKQKE